MTTTEKTEALTCAHCGATDVGAGLPGGYGTVGDMALCHPNSTARPDCYHLVSALGRWNGGHPVKTKELLLEWIGELNVRLAKEVRNRQHRRRAPEPRRRRMRAAKSRAGSR